MYSPLILCYGDINQQQSNSWVYGFVCDLILNVNIICTAMQTEHEYTGSHVYVLADHTCTQHKHEIHRPFEGTRSEAVGQDVLSLMSAALPNVKDLLRFGLAGSAGAGFAFLVVWEDTGAKCRLKAHTHYQLEKILDTITAYRASHYKCMDHISPQK